MVDDRWIITWVALEQSQPEWVSKSIFKYPATKYGKSHFLHLNDIHSVWVFKNIFKNFLEKCIFALSAFEWLIFRRVSFRMSPQMAYLNRKKVVSVEFAQFFSKSSIVNHWFWPIIGEEVDKIKKKTGKPKMGHILKLHSHQGSILLIRIIYMYNPNNFASTCSGFN